MRYDLNKNKQRVTKELAKLVGSTPDQIAITRNATESLDLVISGFPSRKEMKQSTQNKTMER